MFTYSVVEATLAKANGVGPEGLGAFRGRIKNLQRLGIVPSSPGKGKRIAYEEEDIYFWAFCLEFAQFGIDPSLYSRMIQDGWNHARVVLLSRDYSREHRYYTFKPNVLGVLGRSSEGRWWSSMAIAKFRELPGLLGSSEVERVGIVDLTRLRDRVDAALTTVREEKAVVRQEKIVARRVRGTPEFVEIEKPTEAYHIAPARDRLPGPRTDSRRSGKRRK